MNDIVLVTVDKITTYERARKLADNILGLDEYEIVASRPVNQYLDGTVYNLIYVRKGMRNKIRVVLHESEMGTNWVKVYSDHSIIIIADPAISNDTTTIVL